LGLREYLVSELEKEQEALKERLAFSPVEDYPAYREITGEIRGLQRVIRLIKDLPDE
jgi:hypothetical protein